MARSRIACLVGLLLGLSTVLCAPRSTKTTSTHYDQKQTGEYNIQLHLKDFQIIALLGQDSLDSLAGDYDYDYDYSDFTIKPSTSSSTTTTTTTTTKKPDTQTTAANTTPSTAPSTSTPPTVPSPKPTEDPILKPHKPMELFELITLPPQKPNGPVQYAPDQIPVIVQDFSLPTLTIVRKEPVVAEEDKNEGGQAVNVAIMNSEETTGESVGQGDLGEIVQYRKCPQGWSRDKRGRCRKFRRPQFPLGISRLATNLATRLRQPATMQRSEAVPENLSRT